MKITEPFIFTGLKEQELDVEIYILDEKNDRQIYVKTVKVKTDLATFRLRTDTTGLRNVFDQVVHEISVKDKCNMIGRVVNQVGLEQVGEFEQHGNVFTLIFKIKQ